MLAVLAHFSEAHRRTGCGNHLADKSSFLLFLMVRQGIMETDPLPDISGPIDEAEDRHLTPEQRDDIAARLKDSAKGQVSMTAAESDAEAVCYQGEIAEVLEDSGFNVEIDNARPTPPGEELHPGVEATIADGTVRPRHAYRIVQAFRRVGVAVATKINANRRRKNTLFIAVGPNDTPPTPASPSWIAKWRAKFATGLRR